MKKKRKLKKQFKILLFLLAFLSIIGIVWKIETGKVSNDNSVVEFEVKKGSTYTSLSAQLKQENLIRSELFYKLYVKLSHPKSLQAGNYELKKNMNLKTIIHILESSTKHKTVSITFKEGIHFRKIVSLITSNMNIDENTIYQKISDTTYLDSLIKKYWFLTEDIKNPEIYYSLEGYLFPDTYEFNEDADIESLMETMLDNTEKKLEKYKNDILKSEYTIHEIMTMASIVELEASNSDDRAGVAGVFYNRLESGWSLGSDVTTYYGLKLELSDRDLYQSEINAFNNYNTRSSKMAGKLPISPICNPGLESIKAAIYPEVHNYYYFVADKNKKTYFSKTASEHTNTVSKLKKEGLWYQY